MSKTIFQFILSFLLLVVAQVVIFNNLILFNVAIPFVSIYFIISLPITWNTNISLTLGFLLGLTIDIFSDTLGINALACTFLAFMQKPMFHLYQQRDEDLSGIRPSLRSMGAPAYLKYMLTMVLAYCILVFAIDAFAMFSLWRMLLRIVFSTIFTFIIIYALDAITTHRNEKRL